MSNKIRTSIFKFIAHLSFYSFATSLININQVYAASINPQLEQAKIIASNANIKTLKDNQKFQINVENQEITIELLGGDHSTVSFHGKHYSLNPNLSDDENILHLSEFLKENFEKDFNRKKSHSPFWSYIQELFVPSAYASGWGTFLIVAAVAAVIVGVVYAVKKNKDKKSNKEVADKKKKNDNDEKLRSRIAYQLGKARDYREKNWEYLQHNTKQDNPPSNPDGHQCELMARRGHDHMKYYEKGYAPNMENYTRGCEAYI